MCFDHVAVQARKAIRPPSSSVRDRGAVRTSGTIFYETTYEPTGDRANVPSVPRTILKGVAPTSATGLREESHKNHEGWLARLYCTL